LQRQLADRIDHGPWDGAWHGPSSSGLPGGPEDLETSARPTGDPAVQALTRVLRHAPTLVGRMAAATGLAPSAVDAALRAALGDAVPPAGTAPALRYLRDRISVPRDMDLHAARALRGALEATARRDPSTPMAPGPPLPLQHRRDQDPTPFLQVGAR